MRVVPPEGEGGPSKDFQFPEIPTGQIKKIAAVLAVLILIVLGIQLKPWFTVGLDEEAVVLRFGKLHRISGSGIQLKIPFVEYVYIEKVTETKEIVIGQSSNTVGRTDADEEALMVTGDEALVHAELNVQYRISDPFLYRFNARAADETLKDVAEASLRHVVGDREIDAVWTEERAEVQVAVRTRIQELADEYGLGVDVRQVKLQVVRPPEDVVEAFYDVQNAKEESEKLVLEAQGYREGAIPKAQANVSVILREAEAYQQSQIAKAKGEVERFDLLLREYNTAKSITRTRLYLETMERTLAGRKKVILEKDEGVLPLLNLTEVIHGTH